MIIYLVNFNECNISLTISGPDPVEIAWQAFDAAQE
jgi:hypothetical protein